MKTLRRGFYCLVFSSLGVIACELIYKGYGRLRHWMLERGGVRSEAPTNFDILWTNELSDGCRPAETGPLIEEMDHSPAGIGCPNAHCSTRNLKKLLRALNTSRLSIDIAMYMLTSTAISSVLVQAARRGVKVRVIVDAQASCAYGAATLDVLRNEIAIKASKGSQLMHHKFCIVDCVEPASALWRCGRTTPMDAGLLLTGSLNWTRKGLSGNWENVIVTIQPELVAAFRQEFDRMWNTFAFK